MSVKKTSSVLALILIALISLLADFASAGTITYQYDSLNRLERVDYPDGTYVVYTYDELANFSGSGLLIWCLLF